MKFLNKILGNNNHQINLNATNGLLICLQPQAENAAEKQKQAEQQRQAVEDMKHSILTQVLNQAARARCNF